MSVITLSKDKKDFNNDDLNHYAIFDTRKKLSNLDINNFYRNKSSSNQVMLDKLIAFSCYFTFGLSGLILLIANFISEGFISKFTYLHTFQALILGIFAGVFSFAFAIFTNFTSVLFLSVEAYQSYYSSMFFSLELFVGVIISSFALLALFGKNSYLPGLEYLARKFVN